MKPEQRARKVGGEYRRAAVWLAWSISALAAAFGGAFLVLLALNSRNPEVVTYEYWGANAVTSIVFRRWGRLSSPATLATRSAGSSA